MANFNYEDVACYSPRKESRIRTAFKASGYARRHQAYQVDMEHGSWWVTELYTGKVWSVIEAVDGFYFEEV